MTVINERYGANTMDKATVEQRVSTARNLAKTLADKVPTYGYNLNAAPNKDGTKTYVTVFINGPAGAKPGKIQVGEIGAPTFFPGDDMPTADAFLAATEAAGLKLRIFTPKDE